LMCGDISHDCARAIEIRGCGLYRCNAVPDPVRWRGYKHSRSRSLQTLIVRGKPLACQAVVFGRLEKLVTTMARLRVTPAWQPSLFAAPKAKAGGKGIRTPGLLIANETLYQLSYTPVYLANTALNVMPKIPFVHRFYPL